MEVWARVADWQAAGHGAMLGTVTRTWGSAPRQAGACVAIRDDGQIVGSVSGGCVEADLIERCAGPRPAHAAPWSRPSLVQYGVTRDEAARWGLPCGGTLEIVLQPLLGAAWVPELLQRLQARRCTVRELDLQTGATALRDAPAHAETTFDGRTLRAVHGPRWRLLLVGAGQLSRCVAEMAQALDYEVTVCEPRTEYAAGWRVPGVEVVQAYPDDFVIAARPDARTAVVTLTHDPKLDDAALIEALQSAAFYVGALGSRRSTAARRERLALFDVAPQQIAALHGPVGLRIGSRTPPEIAVSILAELTAVRRGVIDGSPAAALAPPVHAATDAGTAAPLSCA